MNLNKDQEHAFNKLVEFITDKTRRVIIIRGPGGTGKTHSVVEFLKRHEKLVGNVCMSAPTNKAVDVLDGFSKKVGRFIPNQTIYSLLGLVLGNEGEVKRTFAAHDGSFDNFETVVLDEGSMAGRQLCEVIDDRLIDNPNIKLIVMLDHCQLPPVNESMTELLNMGEIVDLTIDMRSGNGPLLQKKREIRDLVLVRLALHKLEQAKKWKFQKAISEAKEGLLELGVDVDTEGWEKALSITFETDLDEEGSGVHFLRGKEFDDAMLDQFDTPQYAEDPNFCRVVAWTNKEVDRLNRIIRTRLYGKDCAPYMLRERVCVLTPVYDNGECVFATDTETEILAISETEWVDYTDTESKDPTYKIYRITLQDDRGKKFDVPVMHPESERKFRRRCDFLSDQCRAKKRKWFSFWNFHDTFIVLRPAHALTVHKAQGQTFGCTFVNSKDIMKNKNNVERAQLGYTAMSRPTTDMVVNLKTFY